MGAGKMAKSGVNNTLLKQRNRGLILKLIATVQCSSRIELSQKTGLAKMTVTYIVNEFLERGIFDLLIRLNDLSFWICYGRNINQPR